MSGPSTAQPTERQRSPLIALIAAIVFMALVVAADGILSLTINRDVIAEPDASPLLGPTMLAAGAAVVFTAVLPTRPWIEGRPNFSLGRSFVAAVAIYLAGPLVGAILYSIGRAEPFTAVLFFFQYLASPFVIAAALAGFATVFGAPILERPST